MAASLPLFLLPLFFQSLSADPRPSFSFSNFGNDSDFGSDIALFGDARIADGGSSVRLTGAARSSAGRVACKTPVKLVDGKSLSKMKVSFSTYFSFSISPENGDGLAFSLLPTDFPVDVFDGSSFGLSPGLSKNKFKIFAVEFDTLKDSSVSDVNGNHVGVDIGNSLVSVKSGNVSALNLVLNSGERLHSWIDYEAGSNRMDVRLSDAENPRPDEPLLSYYPIDFSEVWKEGEVLVGLSSSSRNSSQTCRLYSWSFEPRVVPHWLHSQPFLPGAFTESANPVTGDKRSTCLLRLLAALIFGAGCGALIAFLVVFVWTVFGDRGRAAAPEEFEYKKISVVVDKGAMKDSGKPDDV